MVLYMAPVEGLEEWMKTPPEVRKEAEDTMKAEWDTWMEEHKGMFSGITAGLGKTKRVTKEGVTDTKNSIMLYSIVEANSHEEATQAFENHPHFGIPNAWIEVMPINPLPGMER